MLSNNIKYTLAILIISFLVFTSIEAKERNGISPETLRLVDGILKQDKFLLDSNMNIGDVPGAPCENISAKGTQEKCWSAYNARLDYYSQGLVHRSDVFAWQHITTKFIFFVVLTLVLLGMYFAWVQFSKDISSSEIKNAESGTEIEISTSGVKVSSPILGVIILAISLAFFYLYLIYVYPIAEIF